ncbi:MAG: glycosyltransferase family 4 protein [Mesorhizobium sp.]|nr:MAG: glycosyltransferase family 4 protein [Mesorhizobium sp.]
MKLHIASLGNPTDPRTFGGTPYFLLEEGRRSGKLSSGLDLTLDGLRPTWIHWSLRTVLSGNMPVGFQFSEQFLNAMWRRVVPGDLSGVVINTFQLYPKKVFLQPQIQKWFYIDQTLHQLFTHYNVGDRMNKRSVHKVFAREKDQYRNSSGIFATSNWAKRSLVEFYGVADSRVHVVPRGANIPAAIADRMADALPDSRDPLSESRVPLRLIFVGKEWYRKGLDRLIGAVSLAVDMGANVELLVIGAAPDFSEANMLHPPNIKWCGAIDKVKEGERFTQLLRSADVGCLLSRAEAGGISLREFHLAGLAVLGPDVGGAKDFSIPGAAIMVPPSASLEEIAGIILRLHRDRAELGKMRIAAEEQKKAMTWQHALSRIHSIIHGLNA